MSVTPAAPAAVAGPAFDSPKDNLRAKHAHAGVAMAVATLAMGATSGIQALLYLSSFGIDARTDGFFAAFALYASFGVFSQSIRITSAPLLVGRALPAGAARFRRDARGDRAPGRARDGPAGGIPDGADRTRARRQRARRDRIGAADPGCGDDSAALGGGRCHALGGSRSF